jgi:Helicase HerA, central domain
MVSKLARSALAARAGRRAVTADFRPAGFPVDALDDRIAIVGTAGSGKTYAAKGFVEQLLDSGARVAIVDPLGVWWGLRASADGGAAGYPVVVFGGNHADVPITGEMGAALGRLIASEAFACVIDVSELGSNAARRRFMAVFAEALYEANQEPLHLVLDEADLWAPQRPIKGWESLLGHIEEIVRRGRVRGFIPWLITQRPAVVHKDVLSQADILIAMKLTASQDRDAIGAWIEGQADRHEGKRILGDLPRLQRGEGYLWAPGHGVLDRVSFPEIRTFDSSRTPKRGERLATPRTLAEVDLTAIIAALAAVETGDLARSKTDRRREVQLEQELAAAKARIAALEQANQALNSRLASIAALAAVATPTAVEAAALERSRPKIDPKSVRPVRAVAVHQSPVTGDEIHPAARKLLVALAQHAPGRFTWGQVATLAGHPQYVRGDAFGRDDDCPARRLQRRAELRPAGGGTVAQLDRDDQPSDGIPKRSHSADWGDADGNERQRNGDRPERRLLRGRAARGDPVAVRPPSNPLDAFGFKSGHWGMSARDVRFTPKSGHSSGQP